MRIGVLIPDRNDRPLFLENCKRMLAAQTLQPVLIEVVNDHAITNDCDITWRYKIGYERLRNKDLDLIALIENDDWYSPEYLETMAREWVNRGKPDLIGTNYTIYYHINIFAQLTMHHMERSSAMSTLIKPNLNFNWCPDNEPYTDMHIWKVLKGEIFKPSKHICLGIKHGVGKCGGMSHVDRLHRYVDQDKDKAFLKATVDPESFEFYSNYFKKEKA